MQVFNSFQEMAAGTGALQQGSAMSVFNDRNLDLLKDPSFKKANSELKGLLDEAHDNPTPKLYERIRDLASGLVGYVEKSDAEVNERLIRGIRQ